MKHILIVEDEVDISKVISYNLKQEGYQVTEVDNGVDAINIAKSEQPDLILLDVMIPEKDGFEVCRELRSESDTRKIPIIFLTAKTQEYNEVSGLEIGGDDYITKPFTMSIVIARVRSLLRRVAAQASSDKDDVVVVGPLTINPQKMTVSMDDTVVELNTTELCNRKCPFCPRVDPKTYPNQNIHMDVSYSTTGHHGTPSACL